MNVLEGGSKGPIDPPVCIPERLFQLVCSDPTHSDMFRKEEKLIGKEIEEQEYE